jgi:hypothetical protein
MMIHIRIPIFNSAYGPAPPFMMRMGIETLQRPGVR